MKNLVLRGKSEFSGFADKTFPVILEYWNIGVLENATSEDAILNRFCIAPLLHHTITPADFLANKGLPKLPLVAAHSLVLRAWILYTSQ